MKLRESMGLSSMSATFRVIGSGGACSTFCTTWLPYTLSALVAEIQRQARRFSISEST
jgi:hypothetical protein